MSGHQLQIPRWPVASVLAGIMSFAGSALGQAPPSSSVDVQRQVDEAYREVLAKTDSMDARLKYASLLVQAGNFEGGIAALEGLLLSPNAPASIRVELAILYYRLGSYAMSETYLRAAIADQRLDNVLKKQAETMLLDVVKRNRVSALTGTLMVGLRSQSNPTTATGSNQILSNGILVMREDRARPKSDVDGQLWGKLDHVYDFDAQNEASLVTSLVGLMNHYASVDSYDYSPDNVKPFDLSTVQGSTGIRFKPSPSGFPNLTLRPHLLFGITQLNGSNYFTSGGLGLEGNYRISDRLTWSGLYAARRFSYADRSDIIDSALQTGVEHLAQVRATAEVGVNKVLVGEIGFVDHSAKRGEFEFFGPQAMLAYVVTYADPTAFTGHNWTTTLVGHLLQRSYRAADPAVDAITHRIDTVRKLTLQNVMPISRDVSLQLQLDYTDGSSNLPNYVYSNAASSISVFWNF